MKPISQVSVRIFAGGALGAALLMVPIFAYADGIGVSVQSVTPGTSVGVGQPLNFTAVSSGLTSPTYWIYDNFNGSTTIIPTTINATTGAFSWTPQTQDVGVHTLTVEASDNTGLAPTMQEVITVNSQYSLSVQSLNPGSTVGPGQTLSFVVAPSGFSPTSYSVVDSDFSTSVTNADISSSGVFNWVPTPNDVGAHTLTITATDASGTHASLAVPVQVSTTVVVPPQTVTSFSSAQIQGVVNLLQSYGATSNIVQQVTNVLNGVVTTPIPVAASTPAPATGDGYVFSDFIDIGSAGTDVTELQNRLTVLGFYSGPVTGFYGALTTAAVKELQAAHGITQAGYVGPSTRAVLNGN